MTQSLLPGETLVAQLHRHWIVLVRAVVLPILLLVVVLAADFLLREVIPRDFKLVVGLAAAALAGAWLIVAWVRWTGTSITLTDQRVVLASGIFSRQTKVIPLNRIQDVTTRQNVAGRMLNYGTVEIDAAGASGAEVIDHLPAPNQVRDEVFMQTSKQRGSGGC